MFEIKDNDDLFESLEEFVDNINRGGEVEFMFENENYSITHAKGLILFLKIGDVSTLKEFKDIKDLLDNKINNKKIKEIITEIKPYFRSF